MLPRLNQNNSQPLLVDSDVLKGSVRDKKKEKIEKVIKKKYSSPNHIKKLLNSHENSINYSLEYLHYQEESIDEITKRNNRK